MTPRPSNSPRVTVLLLTLVLSVLAPLTSAMAGGIGTVASEDVPNERVIDQNLSLPLLPIVQDVQIITVPVVPGPTEGSVTIDGLLGGTLHVGRFTLVVPPAALRQRATITMRIPDPSTMRVELSISPASANNFLVPVTLMSNVAGTDVPLVSKLQTVWYDELKGVWRPVPGSAVNVAGLQVYAPLFHFSTYGINDGKAGW
jgi:hypothetical protein